MNELHPNYYRFLSDQVIEPFYKIRLEKLQSLKLADILKRKNPYLFRAKNIELAGDLVKSIVDAFLSSQEETLFGGFLESFAIYVSNEVDGGFKSSLKSVDLEFRRNNIYYVVGIKSGINWGNADQIGQMRNNFKIAKALLKEQGITEEIIAVNGCIYGKDSSPFKRYKDKDGNPDLDKDYYKYAGQDFWNFISQDQELYRKIIVPISQEGRQKDEIFKKAYAAKINEMTQDFMEKFMKDNQIDWLKLVDFVSKHKTKGDISNA